jgi:hypothetical protein
MDEVDKNLVITIETIKFYQWVYDELSRLAPKLKSGETQRIKISRKRSVPKRWRKLWDYEYDRLEARLRNDGYHIGCDVQWRTPYMNIYMYPPPPRASELVLLATGERKNS